MYEQLIEIVKQAGAMIREAHEAEIPVYDKEGIANFVTKYDKDVQSFLIRNFRQLLPEANFLAEEDGIRQEREKLLYLKENATYILDTSQLLTRELKKALEQIFAGEKNFKNLMITVLSFGFKYGIPSDCDLVFDVRFLPNPYYVEGLKYKTGNDKEVQDFVMGYELSHTFLDKLVDMLEFLIPNYILEGKNQLVIGIGCTGGKHRSVTLANKLFEALSNCPEYGVRLEHRDVSR